MALTTAEIKTLNQDVKAGDRLGYYNHLYEFGSEYGLLAAGVVTAETEPGAAANLFLLNTAEAKGIKISDTTLAKIGVSLMQADFQARKDGHELGWKEIQEYHNKVFKNYGVPVDSWTPNFVLKSNSLTSREKADYWDNLLEAVGLVGNANAYLKTVQHLYKAYGFDPSKTLEYRTDLKIAGVEAFAFSSNEHGASTLLLQNGGKLIGGNHVANKLSGTAQNDVLMGFDGKDVLYGGGGADRLYGGEGNDLFKFQDGDVEKGEIINGGSLGLSESNKITASGKVDFRLATISAIDLVTAQASSELHFSGAQIDAFVKDGVSFSGAGNVLIDANGSVKNFAYLEPYISALRGHLILNGVDNSESIVGTSHADVIYGQGGDDQLNGSGGNDTIEGGNGADVLAGGTGDDSFILRGTEDTPDHIINGGDGIDTIFASGVNNLSTVTLIGIENLAFFGTGTVQLGSALSMPSFHVIGSSGVNSLVFATNGTINLSNLTFKNWNSDDTITVNGGFDVTGSSQADILNNVQGRADGGDGNDTISGNGYLNGGAGADIITGTGTLVGDNSGDVLVGFGTFELYAAGVKVSSSDSSSTVIFHYNATISTSSLQGMGLGNGYVRLGDGATSLSASFTEPGGSLIVGNDKDNIFHLAPAGGFYSIYGGGGSDTFDIGDGTVAGSLMVWDFKSGEDKIKLGGVSDFAGYNDLGSSDLTTGYYLVRWGTAGDYAVYDHKVSGGEIDNTRLYIIQSNGDYFVNSDFVI